MPSDRFEIIWMLFWMLCSTGEGIWTRKVFLLYDALIGFLSISFSFGRNASTYYPPPHRQQKQHPTINFVIPGSIIYKVNRGEIGERKATSLVFR
jgi:hypothetical protein